MRARLSVLLCLSLCLSLCLGFGGSACVCAAPAADKKNSARSLKKISHHRIDMRLRGVSCAACLIRIEKKLKAERGVLKVVVSIYKPYKAALIYDANSTDWKTLNKILTGEKVTTENFTDVPVDDVPLVLEPR